jgi:hypothetical protein
MERNFRAASVGLAIGIAASLLASCASVDQSYDGWGHADAWQAAKALNANGIVRPPEETWGLFAKLAGTKWIKPNPDDAGFITWEFQYDGSGKIYEYQMGYPVGASPYVVALYTFSEASLRAPTSGNVVTWGEGASYRLNGSTLIASYNDGSKWDLYRGTQDNLDFAWNRLQKATKREKDEAWDSAMRAIYQGLTAGQREQQLKNEMTARIWAERMAAGGAGNTSSSSSGAGRSSSSTSGAAGSSGPAPYLVIEENPVPQRSAPPPPPPSRPAPTPAPSGYRPNPNCKPGAPACAT